MCIRTRRSDDIGALKLTLHGGKNPEIRDAPGPVGTEVLVEDLFFNVPARRKFLKTEATEASHVQDIVQRIGLCYPTLGVRYVRDGRTVEYAPGGTLRSRVREAFGPQYGEGLMDLHVPGGFGMDGVAGHPKHARSTPRHYHLHQWAVRPRSGDHVGSTASIRL